MGWLVLYWSTHHRSRPEQRSPGPRAGAPPNRLPPPAPEAHGFPSNPQQRLSGSLRPSSQAPICLPVQPPPRRPRIVAAARTPAASNSADYFFLRTGHTRIVRAK
nr:unnamed protein product [Digitaria exilis]